jgi:hypothetical protein
MKKAKQAQLLSAIDEAYAAAVFTDTRKKLAGEFTFGEMLERRRLDEPNVTKSTIRHSLERMEREGIYTSRKCAGQKFYKLAKP